MKTNTKAILGCTAALCLMACGGEPDGGTAGHENNGGENNGTSGTNGYAGNNGATNNGYDPGDEWANNGTSGNNGLVGNNTQGAPPDNPQDGEQYEEWVENDWIETGTEPTSTFSIDVDNASYTLMRSDLNAGRLPAAAGVRVEEYVNFFSYGYPEPTDQPFSINMEIAPSEFGTDLHMLRIGLQGKNVTIENMKPTNLVFLIDVSGSMSDANKLPLVKESLHALIDNLRPTDTIGIVTYAGNSGVVLQPTPVSEAPTIRAAIDNLQSGGSTNGEAGIVSAYELAEQAKVLDGNNRVIIATDGDFNVGRTGDALVQLVRDYRDKHISLTCVGYGRGNYNDATMEALARDGNGNYFYVDSLEEAQRIFGPDLPSTIEVIAADVKIQIEFASDTVVRYRLVGYENRVLNNEDFEDDTVDAGEIGPGHTVTALYELEIDETAMSATGLLAEVRLRHKTQYGLESELQTESIKLTQIQATLADATPGLRFAIAVAEFAEILRGSMHSENARFTDIESLAAAAAGSDPAKLEFVELVGKAAALWTN